MFDIKELCGSEEEKEQTGGLMWYDVILYEDRKRFLKFERLFTYAEMQQFFTIPEGNRKENLRQEIFKLRKQFLEFWCKTHSYRNV